MTHLPGSAWIPARFAFTTHRFTAATFSTLRCYTGFVYARRSVRFRGCRYVPLPAHLTRTTCTLFYTPDYYVRYRLLVGCLPHCVIRCRRDTAVYVNRVLNGYRGYTAYHGWFNALRILRTGVPNTHFTLPYPATGRLLVTRLPL